MKKYSILLVDDEESVSLTVKMDLVKAKYAVSTAENGETAIEMLGNNHFDLVITDLMMERVDGIGVLKKAREIHPDILVMVFTGYASLSSAIDALRLGAFDYMQKPCSKDELLTKVDRAVQYIKLNQKIKAYEKFLPVCCVCKKIRDDDGREPGTGIWKDPDVYLAEKTDIETSHGYCDQCADDLSNEIKKIKMNRS
ncbi:hypothetical protein UR09_02790 [Candidatus Nitromaritima sp. SCGC AAA799-A02]|nr:hypothetical protein UR09_02790 [Candidatus Nitromaritima sp. SCGC AAA799-A02]KMP12110.1 hypothetical protein UZ36_02120 [Candidatus Nitromaritima sp. SCGC AAA799-C22]